MGGTRIIIIVMTFAFLKSKQKKKKKDKIWHFRLQSLSHLSKLSQDQQSSDASLLSLRCPEVRPSAYRRRRSLSPFPRFLLCCSSVCLFPLICSLSWVWYVAPESAPCARSVSLWLHILFLVLRWGGLKVQWRCGRLLGFMAGSIFQIYF